MEMSNEERSVLEFWKRKIIAEKGMDWLSQNKMTWATLRMESAVLGTQGQIPFALNADDQSLPEQITEQRLNKVDSFVATRVSVQIANFTGNRSSMRLRTYPNQRIFTGAGEAAALQAIYNAKLDIMVNSNLYFPNLRTEQFLLVPQFQELLANVTALPAGYTAGGWDKDPYNGDDDAFKELIPSVAFSGGNKNTININLAQSVNMTAAGGSNIAVLQFRGFIIQNYNAEMINTPM